MAFFSIGIHCICTLILYRQNIYDELTFNWKIRSSMNDWSREDEYIKTYRIRQDGNVYNPPPLRWLWDCWKCIDHKSLWKISCRTLKKERDNHSRLRAIASSIFTTLSRSVDISCIISRISRLIMPNFSFSRVRFAITTKMTKDERQNAFRKKD